MRALALTLVVLGLRGPAHADGAGDAKARFEAGQRAFAQGDYQRAVDEFLRAYQLKPHPDVLVNLATSYERIYRPHEAREAYEHFLRDAPPESALRMLADNRLRVLRRLPGSILVEANRPGAVARLAGEGLEFAGVVPKRFENLPPGRYTVQVALADHTPVDVEVALEPAGQSVLHVNLVHQTEVVTFFSKPSYARVFIDDHEVGTTPFSRPVEVGRQRRVRLEMEDFPTYSESVDVVAGSPVRRNVTFQRPFRTGRSELVLAAMAYGALGSAAIAEAAGGPRLDPVARLSLDVGASAVGVGVGFLASWLTTDDFLKVGHSSIIIGSIAWGATVGGALAVGLQLSDPQTLVLSLLGSGLGIGTGILVSHYSNPPAGDAALVNSGGMWGSVGALLAAESIEFSSPGERAQARGWLALGGCALGLLTGGLLAMRLNVSRGHVGVVDVAGGAGAALAFAVGYGIAATDTERLTSGSRYGLIGLGVGLLAGALLSRKYKDDVPAAEALLLRHGARWALGLPSVRIGAGQSRAAEAQLLVGLARGEF